ncbi:RNA 2',3'-cyclic phosphodiesterase [Sphingomonas sp. IW22]|uniref:RNA 2',3'-cyclic phosphodiesterase n=1 Tax=Sphingomonas sp. IW22 TaxID=3242489 RepID=UPI00351F88B9
MHRLFVGLRPPRAVRERLSAAMSGIAGARWQSDDQLHITLRFIGEVDRRVGEDVAHALATVAFPPLSLRIEGVGSFDARGRVNAVWAGVRPHDEIARLHRKVDQAVVRAGLPSERRAYLPHITLARFGRGAGPVDRWLGDHAALCSAPFEVDAMILFESHLGSEGASYAAVERYPLTG